jgi:ParB family transcriptional regulator, chromosome partitioning protein
MSADKSRFTRLAQAVKEGTANPQPADLPVSDPRPASANHHKPAAALSTVSEALRDRVSRLEAELAGAHSNNTELERELRLARNLSAEAGSDIDEFHYLDPSLIVDLLPKDRLRGGFDGREFQELLSDIEANGQNDAITVRRSDSGTFEVAAGRRRLEACRRLERTVLARIRSLTDEAMLRVQFSENERRADISALERARWFAEVRERLTGPAKDIANHFGIDPSTFSLYLRLARFPDSILERLYEPQRLAVLPARRIMESIERDNETLQRILDALDTQRTIDGDKSPVDGTEQISILMRAAEGKLPGRLSPRSPVPERRHIVHEGRRIGTLTRNGGQWVFRFATSIPDHTVQLLAGRLAAPVTDNDPPASATRKAKA